jgi:hypothetical protein
MTPSQNFQNSIISSSSLSFLLSFIPYFKMASIRAATASRSFLRSFGPVHRPRPVIPSRISRRTFATPSVEQPRLRLGSEAPNFKAKTTLGDIDFHDFIGDSWTILFSHPADFTPVCTTELGAFAKLKDEFERRGVKMIGLVWNHHIVLPRLYTHCSIRAQTILNPTTPGSKTSTRSQTQTSNSPSSPTLIEKLPSSTIWLINKTLPILMRKELRLQSALCS